jgi:hypothetical protein
MFAYELPVKGEAVEVVLQPFGEMPAKISRVYRGDIEAQMWEAFEWGLKDPAQIAVLDDAKMSDIMELLQAWQEDAATDLGKSKRSSTSRTSTAKRSKQI